MTDLTSKGVTITVGDLLDARDTMDKAAEVMNEALEVQEVISWPIVYVKLSDMHKTSITRDKVPMISVGALDWYKEEVRRRDMALKKIASYGYPSRKYGSKSDLCDVVDEFVKEAREITGGNGANKA